MLWGGRRGQGTIVATEPTECPMPQANDLSRCLLTLEQGSTLIAVVEPSQASWLVAGIVPAVERQPLKKIEADEEALLRLLHRWRDEAARAGRAVTRVAVAFEAGRDGFWLARWLRARGIEAHVIHPSSVAVPREHRRAKTDRLDTELLKRAFLGWLRGERGHCTTAAIPTAEEEDAKRPNREHESLVGERTRIVNRMRSALARLGGPGLQADAAQGLRAARDAAHARGRAAAAEHARRAAPRHGPPAARARADRGGRGGAPATAGGGARVAPARDGPPAGPGDRGRRRDGGHAGARGALARPAGPPGRGALRRPHGLTGRERAPPAGEGPGQGGQRPRAPRHGAARLALPALPEGERAGAVVPGADRRCPRRHAQDHDRGVGEEAAHRLVAARDHRRDAGGRRPPPGRVSGRPEGGVERSVSAPAAASRAGRR